MGLNNINIDPKDMAHVEAIILSMTPYERKHPEVIKILENYVFQKDVEEVLKKSIDF